jgi:hypothetical protein
MVDPYGAAGQPNPFPWFCCGYYLVFGGGGFLPVGGGGVYFVDPHLRTPYIYQYNLSVQRELLNNFVMEVAYIGSNSHKLTALTDSNPFVLGTTKRLFNSQSGLPATTSFSYLDTFANVGNAHYNGGTFGLTKRPGEVKYMGNIGFQLSYTYGKSIDNVSGFRTGASRVPAFDRNRFVSVSNFDLTHFVSFSGSWELPFAQAWSSGPKRITKGWTMFPIITYRSGLPMNIGAGLSRTASSIGPSGAGDPNLVQANLIDPNVLYFDPRGQVTASTGRVGNYYFDPKAFERASLATLNSQSNAGGGAVTNPALRTYGNLGRNALRGPDQLNFDFAIGKITSLTERMRLELRGDFFNAFNNVEFGNPNLSITSSLFGQVSTTAAPRIIQISALLRF